MNNVYNIVVKAYKDLARRVSYLIKHIAVSVGTLMFILYAASGIHTMNANIAKNNSTIQEMASKSPVNLISNETQIQTVERPVALISDEAAIEAKHGIKYVPVGKGTLVLWEIDAWMSIKIRSTSGKVCRTKANQDGKFGCMFSHSALVGGDITIHLAD